MKALNIQKGDRFGMLGIIKEVEKRKNDRLFLVKCDCGIEKIVLLRSLKRGCTISCGCYGKEQLKKSTYKHGHNRRGAPSKTYMTWASMLQRCNNRNEKSYNRYGGRGIKVCKKWHKFENFLADMGKKPDGLTIERIDNSKGYSPKNCKWATINEQARNKRNNVLITCNGRTQNATQWAEELNINREILYNRKKAGFTDKQIIEHKKYANKR